MEDDGSVELRNHVKSIANVPLEPLVEEDRFDTDCSQEYTWIIPEEDLIMDKFYQWEYVISSVESYSFEAKVTARLLDERLFLSIQYINYSNKTPRQKIRIKPMPKVTFTLKDQTDDQMDKIRTCNCRFSDVLVFDQEMFFDYRGDFGRFDQKRYYNQGQIKILISIETITIAKTFSSNNGMIFWELDQFKTRTENEKLGLIQFHDSPYFYTGPFKYRAMIKLKLLSKLGILAIPCILTGEFDHQLTSNYQYRLRLSIFNHYDKAKPLTVCETYNSTDAVTPLLVIDRLNIDKYIVDDSLTIKIEIEPMDLVHFERKASKRYASIRNDIQFNI